jgi:hypothetical protein
VFNLSVELFASTPKDSQHTELNEDAWQFSEGFQRWALSDGASESYDSKTWARLLVARYIDDPDVNPAWVDAIVQSYSNSVDTSILKWSEAHAYERGSFATLIGVMQLEGTPLLKVLAIGDSLIIHLRKSEFLTSYPYVTAHEFDARPQLLSTVDSSNRFVHENEFLTKKSSCTWTLEHGDHIYLMTDAVGQWVLRELRDSDSSLTVLESLGTADAFSALVFKLREERRMKFDDSTLVRLVVTEK